MQSKALAIGTESPAPAVAPEIETPKAKKPKPPKLTPAEREAIEIAIAHDPERLAWRKSLAKNYIRIAVNYYRKVDRPAPNNQSVPDLILWSRDLIVQECLGDKYVLFHVEQYFGVSPKPVHENYSRNIQMLKDGELVDSGYYNSYEPIAHAPKAGPVSEADIPFSIAMMKHIFGDKFQTGLDYMQLLYREPEHALPILCLVSKAQNTGKSTFGFWLSEIYGRNVFRGGNAEIGEKHNEFLAGKLLVIIDETSIDKSTTKEAVKRMSTETEISINPKGRAQYVTHFFGKFVFITNHEDDFMNIEDGETRWFVLKVPELGAGEIIDMKDKLRHEIPAFLAYLKTRSMHQPKSDGRMYFSAETIRTTALEAVIENSRPIVEKEIRNYLRERFLEIGNDIYDHNAKIIPTLEMPITLDFTSEDLCERISKARPGRWDISYFRKTLENMGYKSPTNPVHGNEYKARAGSITEVVNNVETVFETVHYYPTKQKRRFIKFRIYDFLSEDELLSIGLLND